MSEKATTLQDRIDSCRNLLDVFQEERQILQSGQPVKTPNILDMLQLHMPSLVQAQSELE